MDGGLLANADGYARTQMPFLHSLLVVRNNYLVFEKYYQGYNSTTANNVQSITKSVVSILTGIALREMLIDSLQLRLIEVLPEYFSANSDPRIENMTLKNLLTMRSGFEWDDTGDIFWQWRASSDWVRFLLSLPLEYNPGAGFRYNSAVSHLMSVILTKSAGQSTYQFAEKVLYEPLRISCEQWNKDPQGYNIGGFDSYYTPRALAKIGALYLGGGLYNGRQIVPSEWVEESLHKYSTLTSTWGAVENIGYGYFWWLGTIGGYSMFFALGYGGQYIAVFPDLNLLVVTTAEWKFTADVADQHERAINRLFEKYIVPAIVRD
jgi:CubicO group peptidase (beta-lactamase class C family)